MAGLLSFSMNTFGEPIDMPKEGATFFSEFTNSLVTASSLKIKYLVTRQSSIVILPIAKYNSPLLAIPYAETVPLPEGSSPVGIIELIGGFA